ncbi:uncharacterized protein LOC104889646 [Beta vulgaris subsp. vulgaris]|uniref:uncharacterized protein LOC104889646 n=1 Tax=Beta vulgaris subsp. vulgaris TaxID=3555 RepID=UPI002037210E|nr:uncharacterized protein LOC104889646 [Beta vulgaris subsp. vulgaris]
MVGGKKKREETILSSSSSFRSSSYRQDSVSPATSTAARPNNNNAKTVNVGCMSGIFQLMSKYHTRRKFLTFGRKQERNTAVEATTPSPREKNAPPLPKPECTPTRQPREQGSPAGRLSLDQTPRSPSVPAEIRRSSPESSARVVARLMGLDDIPVNTQSPAPAPVREVSPAAEKRRKLLGALEKCDDDLKALKKIIKAVRATQTPPRAVAMKRREEVEEGESEVGSDEPSPVSVLDHHYLSSTYSKRTPNEQVMQQQQQKPKQQRQQITRKKPGDHEDKAINFLTKPTFSIIFTSTASTPQQLQSPAISAAAAVSGVPWSTAMKESVIEVCRNVEFGQIQEVGSIGMLLQDCILRELIEEIIKELSSYNVHVHSISSFNLSYEAYKRKLFF